MLGNERRSCITVTRTAWFCACCAGSCRNGMDAALELLQRATKIVGGYVIQRSAVNVHESEDLVTRKCTLFPEYVAKTFPV